VQELESETAALRGHYEEAIRRVAQLESEFQTAMEALAEVEEDSQIDTPEAADRIRSMRAEIRRLRAENETELLRVREDLEAELRTVNAQLEARQGEIWELTEEVVRLRALTAASAAAADREGEEETYQRNLAEQETRIDQLTEERSDLKERCEQLSRSLEQRKKNIKILAELFKRERQHRLESEPPPPAGDGGEPRSLITMELNIKQLLEEAGADVTDDLDLFDEDSTDEEPSDEGDGPS
jgi:chromosome segregation ATPase